MRRGLVLFCLGLGACPAPADVTPMIHVDPRAAQRLAWLSRPTPTFRPARVHVMRDGEQLGGPNAIGRPGDLLLENDEVVFVIDQLGSSEGFAESGANVVDAADAHVRQDELGLVFSYFGTFPRQGVYDAMQSGTASDGSAWIEARGKELYEPALAVTTRYTLRAPDRALLLETTVENTGDAETSLPSLGDAIQWGGAEKVAPGKEQGFKGPSSGPYVGGVGRFTSYAVTSTEGAVDAISGGSWTDTVQRKDVRLPAHGRATYARVLLVGTRADTSSLVAELALAAGQPVGELEAGTDVAALPLGTMVSLEVEGGAERLTLGPPFGGSVPAGRYRARVGGGAPGESFEVKAGQATRLEATMPRAAEVHVRCVEAGAPVPCKVTFEGLGSTPAPHFGPGHVAGPAHAQVTTGDGAVDLRIAPGRYRLTASRGPEYALSSVEAEVAPGAQWQGTLALSRVVDTAGYVACDFHQHSMVSADAPTSRRDRVVSNAAEGVEVAVATEHNVVVDLGPVVREAHLEPFLVALAGDELTTDASRHPWGHANAWPLKADPARPRGGAPVVRDRPARELFAELRAAAGPDLVLQINHPRSGLTGYFDQLGFDRGRGLGSDPSYDPAFDALEVWNGRNVSSRASVVDDWRALLRTAHPVTPTADTDTHGVVGQEPGYPRTYVRVADDAHLQGWDAARTADLVAGVKVRRDVVLTNGPMLRVTAGGAAVGGVARGRSVVVNVHVECAPWVDVDTVELRRVSDAAPVERRAVTLSTARTGAMAADMTFAVKVAADDALFVVASGSRPLTPVLGGDPGEILPFAMTGAVWIDADGDGRALGR